MNESENLSKESFDKEFCAYLEYHLTRTFANAEDEFIQKIWCDGILMPFFDSQTLKKNVNDAKKIITKAWIGPNGQEEYQLIIKLGRYSLRRYAKGSSL